jgi:hypothetical protein
VRWVEDEHPVTFWDQAGKLGGGRVRGLARVAPYFSRDAGCLALEPRLRVGVHGAVEHDAERHAE